LSLEIQIILGVPTSFSAQKYSFKIFKVLQSQIGQNQKYLESFKLVEFGNTGIFRSVPVGLSAQKYSFKTYKVLQVEDEVCEGEEADHHRKKVLLG
jgi:hypothetical protein